MGQLEQEATDVLPVFGLAVPTGQKMHDDWPKSG
jgi:hypothetical protein